MITEQTELAPQGESADAYNYDSFDYGSDAAEFERWLREGPALGDPAPDFELADLDGNSLRLSALRGRPVVLEFGSYTCPIFSDRVAAMERLAGKHPEATFLVIYVREAHPGEIQGAHRNLAEKRSAAHKLAMEEALTRRVLVDSVEGATHRACGGAWNPVYVVDADGRVVMRQAWNHPADVAAALDALQSGAGTRALAFAGAGVGTRRPATAGPDGPVRGPDQCLRMRQPAAGLQQELLQKKQPWGVGRMPDVRHRRGFDGSPGHPAEGAKLNSQTSNHCLDDVHRGCLRGLLRTPVAHGLLRLTTNVDMHVVATHEHA